MIPHMIPHVYEIMGIGYDIPSDFIWFLAPARDGSLANAAHAQLRVKSGPDQDQMHCSNQMQPLLVFYVCLSCISDTWPAPPTPPFLISPASETSLSFSSCAGAWLSDCGMAAYHSTSLRWKSV